MKVIFMAKSKPSTIEGLRYLIEQKIQVVAVVAPPKPDQNLSVVHLSDIAAAANIPCVSDDQLYEQISGKKSCGVDLTEIDLVLSFLFWKRIREPLITLSRIGCVNFHPAPLPEVRGVCGYTFAIFEQMQSWGVSAHFVDVNFDTGDLVQVDRFAIDPEIETSNSLEATAQKRLLDLFKNVITRAARDRSLPRLKQGNGRYYSKKDFEKVRAIQQSDSVDVIRRKIRACWSPPFPGAAINVAGNEFTLIDQFILNKWNSK